MGLGMLSSRIVALNANYPLNEEMSKICDFNSPTHCPICHSSKKPIEIAGYYVRHGHLIDYFYLTCYCVDCKDVFLCEYISDEENTVNSKSFKFSNDPILYPYHPDGVQLSDAIKTLSPIFAETYNQAMIAESEQLLQVAGPGYRKALEFLVKDYLLHKDSTLLEALKKENLGPAVRRIQDERIRTLAERATWIGNDETHYARKHET